MRQNPELTLEANPSVVLLRQIVQRTDALSVSLPEGYRPTDDDIGEMDDELESWWFGVAPR